MIANVFRKKSAMAVLLLVVAAWRGRVVQARPQSSKLVSP
jgi:hypothetical protein